MFRLLEYNKLISSLLMTSTFGFYPVESPWIVSVYAFIYFLDIFSLFFIIKFVFHKISFLFLIRYQNSVAEY